MEKLERIRELQGRLAELSSQELEELNKLIDQVWTANDKANPTVEQIAVMGELVTVANEAKAEAKAREQKLAEQASQAQALRDQMAALRAEESEEAPEPVTAETPEPEEPEAPEEPEEPVEAIAAAGFEPAPYVPQPDETVQCPKCQLMNEPDASYCDQCGEKLVGNSDVAAPAPAGGPDNAGGDGAPAPPPPPMPDASAAAPAALAANARPAPRGAPAGRAAAMSATRGTPGFVSPERRPAVPARPRVSITAAAGLGDYAAGQEIPSRRALAEAMIDKLNSLDRHGQPTGSHRIVRANWADQYPAERRLTSDAETNTEKIEAVCSIGAIAANGSGGVLDRMLGLTASGGVCLPVNVDYAVPTWATAERPLRDALPSFQADRGGLRYVTPPDITALVGATAVWTEATDANPGGATKPVYQVACGAEQLVYVNAVATRVGFGNMQSRFAPEQIAANTDLAAAAASRVGDLELLALITSHCTVTTSAKTLGTNRDLLSTIDLIVENYRYVHRIPPTVALTTIFPNWLKGMMRADMVRELAHDTNGRDPLAVTDAQIEAWFAPRGVNPIWMLDGLPAQTISGVAIPAQTFAAQTAGSSLNDWPASVAWWLFVEGTFQFLDGGRLDLGVVRDSTLDATNDYETFVETFEGIAYRGIEADLVLTTTHPFGGSGATVSDAAMTH